ncbi:MAG: hypothetical protein ACI9MR_001135 [Myxococcota bacterium]|jgi:hypothetical protein
MSREILRINPREEQSPLALLVRDSRTNRLLELLANQLRALREAAASNTVPPTLTLQRTELDYCRDQWLTGVLNGEHRLYDLATLMTWRLTGTHRLQLVARVTVGPKEEEESADAKRIVLEEPITRDNLKRVTDYSLSHRIARHYLYRSAYDAPFGKLYARASFLELRPLEMTEEAHATRVLTRVKANEQIWNKVCDALFDIDSLVQRDKILNKRSKYVKDVFGIKILTPHRSDSYRVNEALMGVAFDHSDVERLGNGVAALADSSLELLEHKDYLSLPADQKKRTGWEALKNVYRWGGHIFEVQIQTEANYFLEALHLTDTSHRTFEMQRRRTRREFETVVPHYKEMRTVLKYLFRSAADNHALTPPSWLRIVGD